MSGRFRAKAPAEGRQSDWIDKLVAVVNERETERARIARILHDEVSQVLSAAGLQLDVMRMDYKDRVPDIEQRTGEIQAMLEHVIVHLRGLSYELNPSIVERAGLQFALDRLAARVRATFSGALRLYYDPSVRLRSAVASGFYKIAEAAVEDASAQPGCTQIEAHMKRAQAEFVLEVRDNRGSAREVLKGSGQSPRSTQNWLGLLMMKYYASQNGIRLTMKGNAGKGMLVRASCPAEAASAEPEPAEPAARPDL